MATPDVAATGYAGRGMAWGDFDLDGDLDLLLANLDAPAHLLLNHGDDRFQRAELQTLGDLVLLDDDIQQPVSADADNDGDLDLFICGSARSYLFRNDIPLGGGFVLVSTGTNLELPSVLARGTAWADYDNDGLVDLYVCSNGQGHDNEEDKLFRGLGGLLFEDRSPSFLLEHTIGRGIAWCDYDTDGDQDLYVANGFGCPCEPTDPYPEHTEEIRNRMYRNNGDGTFSDATAIPLDDIDSARGCCWGDYDNDGDFDLYIANLRVNGAGGYNKLLRNDGPPQGDPLAAPVFTDVTTTVLADRGTHRSCAFVDVDNDADLDIHVTALNDSRPFRLFLNDGRGEFDRVESGLLTDSGYGAGASWGDYDDDGDMDAALVWNFPGGNRLLRNDLSTGNSWLIVELTGTASNRTAIGARVEVTAAAYPDQHPLSQIREIQSGSGYLSQHMHAAHFGLASATVVESLIVRWPSGFVQRFQNVAVNQHLRLLEQSCAADANRDALVDSEDFYFFLEQFFEGLDVDVNGDGITDSQDLFDFLDTFQIGCSA